MQYHKIQKLSQYCIKYIFENNYCFEITYKDDNNK